MKGTEKIIGRIKSEAQAQADIIAADAKAKCDDIFLDCSAKAKARYEERIAAGRKACDDELERAERLARMESKKAVLALKQEMVGKAFTKAASALAELDDARYAEFFGKLAAEASSTGYEELVFNARDSGRAAKDVVKKANELLKKNGREAHLTAADETGDFLGGFIMRQGSIEVNCTAETLVDVKKNELSGEVASLLFSE